MTNLISTNVNLTTQVDEYANHMVNNDSDMATMKKNQPDAGENKTLKRNMAEKNTNRPGEALNKEFNWRRDPY